MITTVVIFILLIIGFLFPRNAKISLLGWTYLVWLSLNAPQQALLGDYTVYQYSYDDLWTHGSQFEKGYTFLAYLGNTAGLDFEMFRKIFVTFGILMFYLGVRRFTKNHALVLGLYIPTLWVVDIIQMRSFIMMAVMLFAFSLLTNPTFINKVLALFIIIAGASIHSSGYLFLIGFMIVWLIKSISRAISKLVISEVVGIAVLPILLKSSLFIAIISFLSEITGRSTLVGNLTGLFTSGTSLHLRILYYLMLIIVIIIVNIIIKEKTMWDDETINKVKALLGGLSILFVGTALLIIAPDYSRLIRHGLIFLFILIGLYLQNIINIREGCRKILVIAILSLLLMGTAYYVTQRTWGTDVPESTPYLLHLKQY